jgi:hypothetical protein
MNIARAAKIVARHKAAYQQWWLGQWRRCGGRESGAAAA